MNRRDRAVMSLDSQGDPADRRGFAKPVDLSGEFGKYIGKQVSYATHGIHRYPAKFIPQIPGFCIQSVLEGRGHGPRPVHGLRHDAARVVHPREAQLRRGHPSAREDDRQGQDDPDGPSEAPGVRGRAPGGHRVGPRATTPPSLRRYPTGTTGSGPRCSRTLRRSRSMSGP